MKYIAAGGPDVKASAVIQGCMRIDALSQSELDALIKNDLELGINFFDHADIYGGGVCEEKFGQILKAETKSFFSQNAESQKAKRTIISIFQKNISLGRQRQA